MRLFSKNIVLAFVPCLLLPFFRMECAKFESLPDLATDASIPVEVGVTSNIATVMFIENVGQFSNEVRFQVRGTNNTLWLTDDALWITALETESNRTNTLGNDTPFSHQTSGTLSRAGVNLKLTFPGAASQARLEPFDRLETTISYLIGNDPEQWQQAVPAWGGVRYIDLYPGVDLQVTGERGYWTWRFICNGVDCSSALQGVRLRVEGANALTLESNHLQIITSADTITLPLLAIECTMLDGHPATSSREPGVYEVAFPFAQLSQSFSAPFEDDPTDLLYSTFLGGNKTDYGSSIAVDTDGASYITGRTESSSFPTTPGAFDTTFESIAGNYSDAFVVKVAPEGGTLAYAAFLGGTATDEGVDIAVDGDGAVYVTGSTSSSNFPYTEGSFDTTYNGSTDAFVVKVAPDGSALTYSTFLGGDHWDHGYGIAVDDDGAVYVIGDTYSSGFPTTTGAFDTSHNGGYDEFVVKVATDGSDLTFSTFLGGSGDDESGAIAVDGLGAVYATGITSSSNFPTTSGAFDTIYNNGYDAFVSKITSDGSTLSYSTFLGGSNDDQPTAIAVDGFGLAYITGSTDSAGFPTTPGTFDTTHNSGRDAFVTKIASNGNTLVYSTFLGGSGSDSGYDVAVDDSGIAYATGRTASGNFPTTSDTFDSSHNSDNDAFVTMIASDGSSLGYSTFLGGSGADSGSGVDVDSSGAAYITGSTGSSSFPTTLGAFDRTFGGGTCGTIPNTYPCTDVFVVKLETVDTPTIYLYLPLVIRQ